MAKKKSTSLSTRTSTRTSASSDVGSVLIGGLVAALTGAAVVAAVVSDDDHREYCSGSRYCSCSSCSWDREQERMRQDRQREADRRLIESRRQLAETQRALRDSTLDLLLDPPLTRTTVVRTSVDRGLLRRHSAAVAEARYMEAESATALRRALDRLDTTHLPNDDRQAIYARIDKVRSEIKAEQRKQSCAMFSYERNAAATAVKSLEAELEQLLRRV